MKLYVIFGQRNENYPSQYAPEALDIMDEYCYEENPDYLDDKLIKYLASNNFSSVKIIPIYIADSELDRRLNPSPIDGLLGIFEV